ncbi:hypothetical protein [Parasphingorhabdus sp.]|uniref:hypothetical protein n=1 Tax=Parasphingorhabdus sp. TaxID=2709688 RepID=UPI003A914998
MKSYEQDQKQFIRALKEILGDSYWSVVNDARKAKAAMLDGVRNPTPRQINLATAAGNRVMAEAAKQVGVPSVAQYVKDQKEAAKAKHAQRNKTHSQNRQAARRIENVKATPGNFASSKVPPTQGYSLNDSLEQIFKAVRA